LGEMEVVALRVESENKIVAREASIAEVSIQW
jgi:hypothetical protein